MHIKDRGYIGDIAYIKDIPDPDLGGYDRLILPCFFLGIISHGPHDMLDEDDLPQGQFIFQHQFEGHCCSQAICRGIFFPVGRIEDARAREHLLELPEKYGLNSCNSQDFEQLRADWKDIANLDVRHPDSERGSAEALFRFDAVPSFEWLKPIGHYITEFTGHTADEIDLASIPVDEPQIIRDAVKWGWYSPIKGAIWAALPPRLRSRKPIDEYIATEVALKCAESRAVSKTCAIQWRSIDEFRTWLSVGGRVPLKTKTWRLDRHIEHADDIVGAFLYWNGD